jgi:hypothetical protein
MMRILFALAFLSCLSVNSTSQVTTSLTVSQPSATLSEWATSNTAIIYITDKPGVTAPQQVMIKTEIKTTDGTVVATKDLTRSPVFTLSGGTRIFYAKDVAPLELMNFTGSFQNTLTRTGQLPSGTYQLSVQLVEPGTFMPLTPVLTRIFNLTAPQLPYLVLPVNNDSLNAKVAETAIIFRWTPLIPQPQVLPYYRLQVFQVLSYQQPLQALRGNQPVLDQVLRGQTQFIWRPQIAFSTDTTARKFIWTIQVLNASLQPYIQTNGNGEGRSEPFMFIIK